MFYNVYTTELWARDIQSDRRSEAQKHNALTFARNAVRKATRSRSGR
jgi:hypothetical protein